MVTTILANCGVPLEITTLTKRRKPAEVRLVDESAGVDDMCAAVRAAGRFAFDTEFVMEDVSQTQVCLIQVATDDAVYLVDALAGVETAPIWALVADGDVETVVHAGQEDLGLCVQATGRPPRNVFDVQVAAGLVGPDYPLSLAKLVQAHLHVRLHKSQTLTDWRKRPLSADQKRYAVEDVAYLLPVRRKLGRRLAELKREDWAREEFDRLEQMELYRRSDDERLRRVKGVGALAGRALAVAMELMVWREQWSEKLNRPARIVLKDHLLVEIARTGVTQPQQVRALRGINLGARQIEHLCETLRSAAEIPPQRWPESKAVEPETPRETVLTTLLTAVLRSECLRLNVAYALAATKKDIQQLVRAALPSRDCKGVLPEPSRAEPSHVRKGAGTEPSRAESSRDRKGVPPGRNRHGLLPVSSLLSGWRGRTFGRVVDDVLTGTGAVRVGPGDADGILSVT